MIPAGQLFVLGLVLKGFSFAEPSVRPCRQLLSSFTGNGFSASSRAQWRQGRGRARV